MIDGLKAYPAYKDSGVPWLGDIPKHWELARLGALLRERGEINEHGRISEVLSVLKDRGVIPYAEKGNVGNKKSEDITRYKIVRPDDIVVNCMNVIIGSVGLSRYTGCLSPVYYVLKRRSEADDPQYLNSYFQTKPFQQSLVRIGNGILSHRMRIPMELLKRELFPRPPAGEQLAIVRYLEYVNRFIRRYIRAKQQLIKLLEEQKQTIIHRAVTRGLARNIRLKPSSVEWLGEVPAHWEAVALRLRYSQCLGKMLDAKRVLGVHSLPYLRNTDVQWDSINTANLPVMDIAPNEYDRYTVRLGDLLVCEGGEVGRCAIWEGDLTLCGFQKALHRLRPISNDRDVPRFLYYVLRAAAKAGAFDDGHESTIGHLTGDKLRAHRFAFPDRREQLAIIAHLDGVTRTIDETVTASQREIELLREYRTRLVTDAVIGKLDVREVAARLPDGTEELEPPDEVDALTGAEEDTPDDVVAAVSDEAEA